MFGQPTHPSQRSSLLLYIKDRENQTISVLAQQIEILEQSILELKSSFACRQAGLNDDAFDAHGEVEVLRNQVTSLVANLSRVESSISDRLAGQSDAIINSSNSIKVLVEKELAKLRDYYHNNQNPVTDNDEKMSSSILELREAIDNQGNSIAEMQDQVRLCMQSNENDNEDEQRSFECDVEERLMAVSPDVFYSSLDKRLEEIKQIEHEIQTIMISLDDKPSKNEIDTLFSSIEKRMSQADDALQTSLINLRDGEILFVLRIHQLHICYIHMCCIYPQRQSK